MVSLLIEFLGRTRDARSALGERRVASREGSLFDKNPELHRVTERLISTGKESKMIQTSPVRGGKNGKGPKKAKFTKESHRLPRGAPCTTSNTVSCKASGGIGHDTNPRNRHIYIIKHWKPALVHEGGHA